MSSGSSIRRTDLLALSNLRNDGRKPNELRRVKIQLGSCSDSSSAVTGSCLFEIGLTSVLATVCGPTELQTVQQKRESSNNDQCMIDVTIQVTSFADSISGNRRRINPYQDRRYIELSSYIQSALESCILLQLYPNSIVYISICILQDDGNRFSACFNAAMCAILDAGIPTKDICCACTAGYPTTSIIDTTSTILIDLNRKEESGNSSGGGGNSSGSNVILSCAMLPTRGTIVWTNCDSGKLSNMNITERLLEAAMDGCRAIYEHIQLAIRERSASILAARNGNATIRNAFSV